MKKLNKLKSSLKVGVLLSALLFFIYPLKAEDPELNVMQMSCISWLQVSLSEDGTALLTPQMLLSNSHNDYSIFEVNIVNPPIGGNLIDCELLNETISVMVTNTQTNNSCWSMVFVEDKLPPVIECSEREINCWQPLDFADPDYFLDSLSDNCTETEDLDLWFSQNIQTLNCDPEYEFIINRTWTVTDNSGNTSSCEQTIGVLRGNINEVVFPVDTLLDCPFTDTDPDVLGYPTLNGNEITPSCGIIVGYTDTNPIELCNGGQSYKFFRTWTAMDWCAMEIRTTTQTIEVKDTIPPVLTCPDDVTIFTGIQTCNATYIFPNIEVEDACSDPNEIDIRFRVNGTLNFDPITVLPVGDNTIEVQAIDPCLNMSTCEYTVTVEDNVPPVLFCHSLVISLPGISPTTVTVEAITTDFIFTDNCEVDTNSVVIRRMEDLCDNPSDLDYGSTIDLCCEDVGNPVMVEVQVSDINGNANSCMFEIEVQDKTPPVITFCPEDTTINCDEEMEDLSIYGVAEAEALCDVDIIEEVENNVDNCGEGLIIRTFIADNGSGVTDTCVQTIQVVNPYTFTIDTIIWPENIETTICDADLSPSGLGGEPVVEVGPTCSMVFGVGFRDSIPAQSEDCERIYRIWSVTDSCSNIEITHIQELVFNLSEGPIIDRNVTDSETVECLDEISVPTLLPIVVDACGRILDPVGPVVENDPNPITCEGERTYTWTYTDCSGNTLEWTFTYTIEYEDFEVPDNDGETVSCPDETDEEPAPPIVEDACGNEIIPTGPVVSEKPTCDGERTYTWTYTDCAGNSHDWVFIYTIEYEDFEVPDNDGNTVSCPDETDEEPTPPIVEDACGNVITPTGPVVSEKPDCDGERTYTWIYTDCAGFENEWVFTYFIEKENFEIIEPNVIDTIECPLQIVTPQPPVVFDNCNNELDAVLVQMPEIPECEGEAEFVFEYEDCAGNIQLWSYTYVVVYQPFETIPDFSFPIMCPGQIGMPDPPEVFDNCFIELEPIGDPEISEIPECEGMVTFTWTFEDCAGNQDQFTGTFIIELTDPPTEIGGPVETSAIVNCVDQATEPVDLPIVEDACGNILSITSIEISDDPDLIDCEGTRTYTYTYEDCAGNEFIWEFTYIIELSSEPIEVGGPVPTTATIECLSDATAPTVLPVVEDACGNVLIASSPVITDNPDSITCEGTRTYTYTYVDCAENVFEWEFIYTIDLTTNPIEVDGPVSTTATVECLSDATAPTVLPVVEDACGNVLPAPAPEVTDNPDSITCEGTRIYTYVYEDCSGNEFEWEFIYTIDLTTNPIEVDGPVSTTAAVECLSDATAPTVLPVVEDACGNVLPVPAPEVTDNPDPLTCEGTRTYTYVYVDCAGNEFEWEFIYTIDLTTLPTETGDPVLSSLTVECVSQAIAPPDLPVVVDACGNILTAPIPEITDDPDPITCEGSRTYTYIYEDCAGNEFEWEFTYTIELTTSPSEVEGPVDTTATVECISQATAPTALPIVEDVCGNVLAAPTPVVTDLPDPITCEGTRTYTYTYVDCVENEFVWEFTYEIEYQDFEVPEDEGEVVSCPDDTDIEPTPPVVLDACGNPLVPNGPSVSEKPECEGQRTYTWTYIDCTENSKEWSFVYTVLLEEGPSLPPGASDTISCPDSLYMIPVPTNIVDQCGRSVEAGEPQIDSITENNLQIITYTYEYEDCAGNISEWMFTLVIDVEDLEIECPENIVQINDIGLCVADITIETAVVTGGCGIDSLFNSYNSTEDASDTYPVGVTEVTFTVVDITGVTATCTFTVTVNDDEAPVIDCPSDITVSTDEGECFATEVDLGDPEVNDNCPGVMVEVTIPDTFEVGLTEIVYTAIDSSGNSLSCTQMVSVEDNEAPTIECPEELVVSNDAGECFATDVEFDPAAVSDNCGIDTVTITAPDTFFLGANTIVYMVTDIFGNTAECEASVTVIDNEAPVLDCPDEVIVVADPMECEAEVILIVTATDNCTDSLLITNSFNDGGADASGSYPVGETIVVFTAEDEAGNVGSCSVTVIVEGDDPLEIECPENIVQTNDSGLCEADITIDPAMVTGGCGIDSLFNNYNFTEDASDIYPVGVTEVTFTVVDILGATATCTFTVTVNDEEAPVIDCPLDITVSTDEDECFATDVDLGEPEVNDNCPGVMVEVTIPDTFEVGLTVIVYTAIDSSGNSSSCTQMVVVEDNEDPSISCPGELVLSNDAGECFATDVEFDPAAVSDNCGIDTVIIAAPDTFFLGSNTIIYTVFDINGNSAICEASILVIDDEAPMLNCPDEVIVEVDPMECEADVMLIITATDNCTDSLLITNSFNDGGADASDIYPVGETIVVFTVEDEAGNVDSCSVTVIVEGDEPLEIECPEDIIQTNDPDSCEANIVIPPAMVSGGCGIESIGNDFNFTEDASGIYPVGETVVEFTVIDATGATASCTFTVIVEDIEDPVIVCPEDIVQENDPGECGADIEVNVVSFSDNCGIDTIFNSFSETIEADGFYPVDTTIVTYTVIDVNGNSAECSFTVVIFDNEIPMLTCPDDITIEVDPGECEAMVTGLIATATDNCTDSLEIINSFNDGGADASDLYPLGETIVVFTVADNAGNVDSCSVTILIEGDEPLEVICPEDVVVDNDMGECFAFVSIDSAMVSGGCGLDSLFNDFNFTGDASDTYDVGVTVVTFTAIDEVGSTVMCSFTVTVEDAEDPSILCPEDITVSTDEGQCFATGLDLGDAEADDNCPGVVIEVSIPDTFEIGTTSITYTAIDSSGNTAECEQLVSVEDNEDPMIICPENIVQANDPGECGALLDIEIPDFSDNCPGASITNDYTNIDDASAFYPVDTTLVTYTVVDASGNSTQCSFTVIVFDDEAPEFIACPENEVLPCSEYEEGLDITQFGAPEVDDNCPVGLQVVETFEIDIDTCTSTGTITRMFTVFDSAGNSDSSCVQVITFEGITSLDSTDFIWPDEFILVTDCSIFNPDSIPGGEPILNPDVETCNEVSIVMEDEIIMLDTACDVIIRTWTVTDLCNPATGQWEFIQTITVEDTIGPEFTVAPLDTLMAFADTTTCDAFVEIMVEAIDDCAGEVIITNNSPFADSSGADASGFYPVGLTTFEYEAIDNCGNITTLEVNVLVIDTIPPDIDCFKFRYSIDDNLSATASVGDFFTFVEDNCSDSSSINFTFDLSDPFLDTLEFNFSNCDSIPGLYDITLYGIDQFGNIDSCITEIGFDDPFGFCPDSLTGNINGLVYHHDMDRMVEGVEVNVESPFFSENMNTDDFGLFEFLYVPQESDMYLRPFKDDDPLNGVTTFDIYLMQRHILGINVITDAYYLIAADINNDGLINVMDVLELRRLILGTYDEFPNNTSWRFLDKNFVIPHGVMPTQIELPETVDVFFTTDRFFQQDFIGVKIGDLNGNVSTSDLYSESRQRTSSEGVYVKDHLINAGETVTVDFKLRDGIEFNGIQFDLRWDNVALDIEGITWADQLEITDNSYQFYMDGSESSIRLSQSSPSLLKTANDGQLFSLTFIANQSGKLSEWIRFEEKSIPTELFYGFSDYNSLELRFSEVSTTENDGSKSFQLFQNRPNPFTGLTTIPFITDEDGRASLIIYDVTGKQVALFSDEFSRGYHTWEVNAAALGLSSGVYYYQLQVGNHQAVRKMIVK